MSELGQPEPDGADPIPDALTLRDALRLVQARNPTLAAARAGVDAAAGDRVMAGRRPNPVLTLDSAGYPLFDRPRPTFWNGQELNVRVDQEWETAGRRRLRTEAATAGIDVARFDLTNRAREIELLVKRAYLSAALAQADRGVAQTTLEEIDRVITLNRARFEQGEISGVELRRLQVERLRFVDDLFTADLALNNARSTLLALLNAPQLDRPIALTDTLATLRIGDAPSAAATPVATPTDGVSPSHAAQTAATPPSPASAHALLGQPPPSGPALVAQALARRPDAQAARVEQALAETRTRLQRALRTPTIVVGAGYRRDQRTNGVSFGVTVPLPLFNRNEGGIARADAERRAADARAAAVDTTVRLELQQALDALAMTRARVRYIERESLAIAREARDIVFESYRVGAADLIDYLDAQRAFRDTLRTYNRALFDERLSLFALAAATGQSDLQPQEPQR